MVEITAPRDYAPGDLIHEEGPFAYVLQRSLKDTFCEGCLKLSHNLMSCKQCQAVKYCGRECQKSEWKDHKFECKHLKNLPECENRDIVRLCGKIILKIKNVRWKNIQTTVLGKVTSFHDLDSRSQHFRNIRKMKLFFKEFGQMVRMFIGNENMPNEEDFIEIFGKANNIHTNVGNIPSVATPGIFFFLGVSHIEQNCIPNCNQDVIKKTVKIWAMKTIKKGSKISIRSGKILDRYPKTTEEMYCKCIECTLPYGESILNRITDEYKAYSVIVDTENLFEIRKTSASMKDGYVIVKKRVDELLDAQRKVLGPTHELHLKTLAMRCFEYDGDPTEMRILLKELEDKMRMVFGELYLELCNVYEKLIAVNFRLGNHFEASIYMKKVKKMCI